MGNLTLNSGDALAIELGGLGSGPVPPAQFDNFNVSGVVTLNNATLNLSLIDSFTPTLGNTFTIIDNDLADAVIGTFSNPVGNIISANGYNFRVDYNAGSGGNNVLLTASNLVPVISVQAAAPADSASATKTETDATRTATGTLTVRDQERERHGHCFGGVSGGIDGDHRRADVSRRDRHVDGDGGPDRGQSDGHSQPDLEF